MVTSPGPTLRSVLALVASLLLSVVASGCSLAGMGIGSMIPSYTTTTRADLVKGDEMRVDTGPLAQEAITDVTLPSTPVAPRWTAGRYDGVHEGRLVLETCDGTQTFAPSDVRRIEIQDGGNHWKTGLIAGGVADVLFVTLVVVLAATYTPSYSFPGYAISIR
jgi:hypothetical protein